MSEVLTGQGDELDAQIASEEQARQIVDEIKRRGARLVEQAAQLELDKEDFGNLVGLAYRHRAWIALGYSSWEELAKAEFSEARFFDGTASRIGDTSSGFPEGVTLKDVHHARSLPPTVP